MSAGAISEDGLSLRSCVRETIRQERVQGFRYFKAVSGMPDLIEP